MNPNKAFVTSIFAIALVSPAQGGTFLFAESQADPNLIAHPTGYDGTGGTLEVNVCIATDSESQSELEIPVQNAVATWSALEPSKTNVTRFDDELASNQFDVESVLLHELGHCIGLAHPNLANESNLADPDDFDYAKTLKGENDSYDLGIGGDGVRGSRDDQRGDDVNLNWFRIGSNDPFLYESEIDLDTYSNNIDDLPAGHSWVEIASFEVSDLRNEGSGEGVMIQGTVNQETQRNIHNEDATTLRIGMSGLDEKQGTGDDYDVQLIYLGISDSEDCDITIRMEGDGFGVCKITGGTFLNPAQTHISVGSGEITLGSTDSVNWYFNTTSTGDLVFEDRFEE